MIKYIRKHKLVSFIIFIFIVFIATAYFLFNLFLGSNGMPVYGSRLDGIEKVIITKEQMKKMADEIKKEDFVLRMTDPYINGRTLKVIVNVDYSAKVDLSKKLSEKILAELSDEQKKFFDIDLFIDKYYDCNLVVSGVADEDGNFVEAVTVKFSKDLSKNPYTLNYGITNTNIKDYNKKQEYLIDKDGEYIIYGFTQDKSTEQNCSIKIIKQTAKNADKTRKIYTNSLANPDFPLIGKKSAKSKIFVW